MDARRPVLPAALGTDGRAGLAQLDACRVRAVAVDGMARIHVRAHPLRPFFYHAPQERSTSGAAAPRALRRLDRAVHATDSLGAAKRVAGLRCGGSSLD